MIISLDKILPLCLSPVKLVAVPLGFGKKPKAAMKTLETTTTPTRPQNPFHRRIEIDNLARMGLGFVLLAPGGKNPIEENWQHQSRSSEQAKHHAGNIGVHAGKLSDNIIWIDIDINFPGFLDSFPRLKDSLTVTRDNDPYRGKVAVKLSDRLPRSTVWRPELEAPPQAELLSTGRQAAVIGLHPSGVPYRNNGKSPIEMTFGDLSAIWRRWTGEELPDPLAPKVQTKQPHKTRQTGQGTHKTYEIDPDSLLARIKASWTAYGVFKHFSLTGETTTEPNGDIRILGNGGLTVGNPKSAENWRWFSFSEDKGGDQIDAWGYCTGRPVNRETFHPILLEMAAIAGIDLSSHNNRTIAMTCRQNTIVQQWPVDQAIDHITANMMLPSMYPNPRYQRTDRLGMLAILETMRKAGRVEGVKLSCRELAELINVGYTTAAATLKRLCRYGYLERTDGTPWLTLPDGAEEQDQYAINMFEAYAYSLTPVLCTVAQGIQQGVCEVATEPYPSTGGTSVTTLHTAVAVVEMNLDVMREYLNHDAFAYGAKAEDDQSLGKAALDVITALTTSNDLTFAEIAEATGMSRSTASKKAHALEVYGLAEVYKEGRSNVVYLVQDWRERLERVWARLNTYCRNLRRKVSHLEQRILRLLMTIHGVTSGQLHKKLTDLLNYYRVRLFNLNRQISELRKIRQAMEVG